MELFILIYCQNHSSNKKSAHMLISNTEPVTKFVQFPSIPTNLPMVQITNVTSRDLLPYRYLLMFRDLQLVPNLLITDLSITKPQHENRFFWESNRPLRELDDMRYCVLFAYNISYFMSN